MERSAIPTFVCKGCNGTMKEVERQRYQGMYSILFTCNCGKRYRTHVKIENVGKVVYQAQMV